MSTSYNIINVKEYTTIQYPKSFLGIVTMDSSLGKYDILLGYVKQSQFILKLVVKFSTFMSGFGIKWFYVNRTTEHVLAFH